MGRPRTFVLEWIAAVIDADVSTNAKAVALALAHHADYATGRGMTAATATIAIEAHLKDRATRYALTELRDARLLTWADRPTAPGITLNRSLVLPNGGTSMPVKDKQRRHDGATATTTTVAPVGPNGGTDSATRWHPHADYQGPPGPTTGRGARCGAGYLIAADGECCSECAEAKARVTA